MSALNNNQNNYNGSKYNPSYAAQSPYVAPNKAPAKKNPTSGLFKGKEVILIAVIGVLLVAAGFLAFSIISGNNMSAEAEREMVLTSVRNLVNIDADDEVSVVKVEDADSFKRQNPSFYRDVTVGNYVMVMATSQRVLIYDKAKNKIVNFSSYTVTPELIDESTIAASEKPLKIELRYAKSLSKEVVDKFAADLQKLSQNYQITTRAEAKSDSYKGITLVTINKTNKPKMLQNLQNQINSSPGKKSVVDTLPASEDASTADAVIFIGS